MPLTQTKYLLDGKTLTIQQLDLIITNNIQIDLTQQSWQQVKKSRSTIQSMIQDNNTIVYGVNTGFGCFAHKIISSHDRQLLQNNLIRSHSTGVGQPIHNNTVKRMMILRINTLSKGRSGIDPENLRKYINSCNANYFPLIPSKGTVGASGDLIPLAHLALGMMGQGKSWCQQTKTHIQSQKIMQQKHLTPILLKQKQGLALINGTQFMTSIITQVYSLTQKVLSSAIIIFLFTIEIFWFDSSLFSQQIIHYYNEIQPSLAQIMKKIKHYLNQPISQLQQSRLNNPHPITNSTSIIQSLQNFASVLQTLNFCSHIINNQINSSTDNPLLYFQQDGFDKNILISAGNFHGQYVAKVADFISMSLLGLGKFSEARIQRYVNDKMSDLPPFLIQQGGLNSGYMIIQYTSAALLSQSKLLAKPASADSITTSANQQDHVSMGGYAARKSRQILQNISYILGIELICALQSIDLLKKHPSNTVNKIHKNARKYIKFLQKDCYFGYQIDIAKNLIINNLSNLIQ